MTEHPEQSQERGARQEGYNASRAMGVGAPLLHLGSTGTQRLLNQTAPPPQLSIMCVSPSQLQPLQLNTFFALCTCSLPLLLAVPPACSSCLPACVSAGEPHGGELHLSACSFIHPSIQSGALMGRLLPAGAMPAVPVTTANKIQSSSSRSSGK